MKTTCKHVAAVVCLGLMAATAYSTEIIAHRGASYDAPENTLAAFRLAYEQKADAIELDMYLTRDGKVVLSHDKTTSRTTEGKTNLTVEETDYAELAKLDVGTWKDPKYAGEKMPLLEEVLKNHPAGTGLFLELKSKQKILPEFEKVLRASPHMKESTIITFDLPTATEAKQRMPEVPVYWVIGLKKDELTSRPLPPDPKWIDEAKQAGLDGLDLDYRNIKPAYAKRVQDAGLKLYAWTVDEEDEAKRLVRLNVLGITTNRPGFIREALKAE
jgi:glycerophosphoryl diester phosphodiesterase